MLVNNSDIDILETELISYFDHTYTFGAENNLNLAVAFVSYDKKEDFLDPSYGELVFKAYEWGLKENGETYVSQEKIES